MLSKAWKLQRRIIGAVLMFISAAAIARSLYIVLKEGVRPSLHQTMGMGICLVVLTVGYNLIKGQKWARITLIILSIVGTLVAADLCLFAVVRMRFDNFFYLTVLLMSFWIYCAIFCIAHPKSG